MDSNRQGLNARCLLETISTGTYSTAVESSGDSFRELVDSRKNSNINRLEDYMEALQSLMIRLRHIEKHGYTSPDEKTSESRIEISMSEKIPQKKTVENTSKSKKKKKKKKDNQATKVSKHVSNAQTQRQTESDPMVSALLAMGFSNEQIDAAVLAFGGTDRVTADDMVVWILERESNGGVGSDPSREVASEDAGSTFNTEQQFFDADAMQRRAEQEAKKEAEEALQKIAEAKAAAERLAAKREEQRRIRREWNNREQIRQQEETQAKLAEEVQRRRRVEAERAKANAQRVAEERAAPSVLAQAMSMPPFDPSGSHGIVNAGSAPLFSAGMNNPMNDGQSISSTQSTDQPKASFTPGIPPGIPLIGSNIVTSGSKSPKPNNKSTGKNGRKRGGRSQKNSRSPKGNMKASTILSKQQFNEGTFPASYDQASYDENPLGEIRATAREFVPSFAPASKVPAKPLKPKPMPQSAPPGLGLHIESLTKNLDTEPLGSLSMLPSQSATVSSLDPSSSNPFPLVPGMGIDRASSAPANVPNDISSASIPGLSMPGNNFMPGVLGSNSNREDELVSSILNSSLPLDGQSHHLHQTSHDPLGSLGALESSSGGSIWGGGSSVPSSNIGFGFASQADNATASFSSHDANVNASASEKKDATSSTWGSFGPSSGGSIW